MAVFLLIGKTSALTMNIAGVVKDWMLIGLSVLLYASPVTPLNLGGYFLAFLAGKSCSQRFESYDLPCCCVHWKTPLLSISLLCPCSLLLQSQEAAGHAESSAPSRPSTNSEPEHSTSL